ncbi:MAG: phasin family protein [Pseudomonadota bacterium]
MAGATQSKQSSQTRATGNGYTDFTKFGEQAFKNFQDFKVPGFETEQLMSSHRRNMETLAELQKAATETARAFGRLQSQCARQAMEDAAAFSRTMMQAGTNFEDQVEAQSCSIKQAVKRATDQSQELTDILNKSQQTMAKLCNARLSECVDECSAMTKKAAKTATKK